MFPTMKKSFIILAFLLAFGICHAQDEAISFPTERPGTTRGTAVLPLHKVSWENGFSYEHGFDNTRTTTFNNTIIRYGIFENVEIRVGTDFLMCNDLLHQDQAKQILVTPFTFGTKIRCFEGEGILPSVGVLAEFHSPHIGSTDLLPSHLAPTLHLIFENEVTDWFSICYNAGAEWDGETATPTTFLGLSLGFSVTDEIGTYVETFHYLHPDENQHMGEFGLTFSPSPRLQLDVETILDLQHLKDYFLVGCGIAWMIN